MRHTTDRPPALGQLRSALATASFFTIETAAPHPLPRPERARAHYDAMRALVVKISDDVSKKIDAILPGPGREAPEAYAW